MVKLALAGWYTSAEKLRAKTRGLCQYFVLVTDDIDADSQFTDRLQNVFYLRGSGLELYSLVEGERFTFTGDFTVRNVQRFGDDFGWKRCRFPLLNLSSLMQFDKITAVVFHDDQFDAEAVKFTQIASNFSRVGLGKSSDLIDLIPESLNAVPVLLIVKNADQITVDEFSFDALNKAVSQTAGEKRFALSQPKEPEGKQKRQRDSIWD